MWKSCSVLNQQISNDPASPGGCTDSLICMQFVNVIQHLIQAPPFLLCPTQSVSCVVIYICSPALCSLSQLLHVGTWKGREQQDVPSLTDFPATAELHHFACDLMESVVCMHNKMSNCYMAVA